MKRFLGVLLVALGAGCSSTPEPPKEKPLTLQQMPLRERGLDEAIRDGVAFLLKSQRPKGYWGSGSNALGWDIYASAPGSHQAFRVATTALCARALREVGTPESLASAIRAEDWLASEGLKLRRSTQDEIYNVWGHTFSLYALAAAIKAEKDPVRLEKLRHAAEENAQYLAKYETCWGGWNYYDFAAMTKRPSMEPTSFGTAAGMVGLREAKDVGIPVDPKLERHAQRVLEKCRTKENTYLYSYDWRYYPMGQINRPPGSLGRTQACNFALWQYGSKEVKMEDLVAGFERLFKLQGYLECGRKRPIPHEAYYAVAGYFYYFGHYFASRLLEVIPPDKGRDLAARLSDVIRPKQEEDGSWWDFGMWDFHKPYGTAFCLMILKRCRDAGAPGS